MSRVDGFCSQLGTGRRPEAQAPPFLVPGATQHSPEGTQEAGCWGQGGVGWGCRAAYLGGWQGRADTLHGQLRKTYHQGLTVQLAVQAGQPQILAGPWAG